MSKHYQILILMIAGAVSTGAFADSTLQTSTAPKAFTRIDFNKLIDDNNADKQDLQKSVANKMDVEPATDDTADKKKVMDFVDVEVGVGEDHPVVMDRRYNSIGEPRLAPEFNNAQPTTEAGANSGT